MFSIYSYFSYKTKHFKAKKKMYILTNENICVDKEHPLC